MSATALVENHAYFALIRTRDEFVDFLRRGQLGRLHMGRQLGCDGPILFGDESRNPERNALDNSKEDAADDGALSGDPWARWR